MKLYLYKTLFYISILFSIFNMFWMLYQNSGKVDKLTYLSNPTSVNGMDKIYVLNDDTIAIHNYICGSFQFFDFDGNFIWGVCLPTTKDIDDTLISYDENMFYLWEGKSKTIYSYKNYKLVDSETRKEISDKNKFYEYYPLKKAKYIPQFKWNGILVITDIHSQEVSDVRLNTSFNYYSFIHSIVGIFIGAITFTIIKKRYL
ncbi:MAG: hypothetical protein E7395_01815 [Ruminococcaceae bacterium]|nr:hypothetical protein [Oscillospiraceae bacterium]